ncbi:MAG: 3-methyl-2-oxobutanoate hydroxymethyltransferase [Acidimicrobiaceae bacterium]|nr:3-methyl-2-oxobutanoate hydroxymethyltransferase [Acidimicrobiaceae bacterium]MXZ64632.1 3-methyl-2-oxobutanoate hydroxymethyltransferase [Acidimicrobiaceae bacterium]MYF34637.1 3-methyl-2-oxobutanoate hydroxymethyltransferase [Acidimicrobiaceae bacterium]MYG79565.1 3-methyl-2-oxobutanoate hydroxymethyltransferase [Acidimicrobiaceae bacterium]MYJ85100.1 3-methyl-2-oxobutanoate hydroxymethyltransferase [Acidimicrobiaceae bacterium]
MTRAKPTVAELIAGKGKRQLTDIFVLSLDEVRAAEEAGLDMMCLPDEMMSGEVREAAPTTFIIAALAYGVHATTDEYLRMGMAVYRHGADAVYCAAGLDTVARLAAEGLPVVGHIGFIPTHRTWYGGYRAVGKTAESALRVWRQARALEEAGAFAAEIELVPEPVAAAIFERSSLFLISMGSGAGCDAQYLFSMDILGTNTGHYPRHSKKYRDFRAEYERLHAERVAAYSEYRDDVVSGAYPAERHKLQVDETELARFIAALNAEDETGVDNNDHGGVPWAEIARQLR